MNDLQLALLGAGGVLVAGVYGHGKWQEYRQRKLAEKLLNPEAGDALMEKSPGKPISSKTAKKATRAEPPVAERREPVIGQNSADEEIDDDFSEVKRQKFETSRESASAPSFASSGAPNRMPQGTKDEPGEPLLSETPSQPLRQPVRPPRPSNIGEPTTDLVSNEADYIAQLRLPEVISGEQLLSISRDALSLLRRRVAWVGYDEGTARWEQVQPVGRYRELRIGLQLADRTGPINTALVDQFKKAVERIGDELTAVPEIPVSREAVARAINLDRLCAEVDIQLAVHLAPRHDPFVPDIVRDTALGKGFRLSTDGVLGYHDAAGDRLFLLQMPDARAPDGLPAPTACCILEVPCIAQGELAFDRMMAVSQELADALNAMLVDEHRRPITERFVAPVRQQIGQLQSRMAQQGVPAGSPLALRLFA